MRLTVLQIILYYHITVVVTAPIGAFKNHPILLLKVTVISNAHVGASNNFTLSLLVPLLAAISAGAPYLNPYTSFLSFSKHFKPIPFIGAVASMSNVIPSLAFSHRCIFSFEIFSARKDIFYHPQMMAKSADNKRIYG